MGSFFSHRPRLKKIFDRNALIYWQLAFSVESTLNILSFKDALKFNNPHKCVVPQTIVKGQRPHRTLIASKPNLNPDTHTSWRNGNLQWPT